LVQNVGVTGLEALVEFLRERGVTLVPWGLAWARVLPLVLIVPAFGARVLPAQARIVLGLALSLTLVAPLSQQPELGGGMFAVRFALEMLRGLPIALSVSALLWAAMMAGGVMDDLRGAQASGSSVFADAPTPIATLLGLFVAAAFIRLGGAASAVEALATVPSDTNMMLAAVRDIVAAVEIALALAAPVLVAVVVFEVAGALVARAASPAHIRPMLDPLRSLLILVVLAFSLDGMLGLMTRLLAT
jgi:type III secretory pathway component EscT